MTALIHLDVSLERRLLAAAEYRRRVVENSNAYRLVYSEGDLLPSIIVDRYGGLSGCCRR